jgi:hypothetical protein
LDTGTEQNLVVIFVLNLDTPRNLIVPEVVLKNIHPATFCVSVPHRPIPCVGPDNLL